jgi:type IV secretory pathway VirB6-like protein
MKRAWFKGCVVCLVLVSCVFAFAAALTLTAEEALACYCNCWVCWECQYGCFRQGECDTRFCGSGPCCVQPEPLIPGLN